MVRDRRRSWGDGQRYGLCRGVGNGFAQSGQGEQGAERREETIGVSTFMRVLLMVEWIELSLTRVSLEQTTLSRQRSRC